MTSSVFNDIIDVMDISYRGSVVSVEDLMCVRAEKLNACKDYIDGLNDIDGISEKQIRSLVNNLQMMASCFSADAFDGLLRAMGSAKFTCADTIEFLAAAFVGDIHDRHGACPGMMMGPDALRYSAVDMWIRSHHNVDATRIAAHLYSDCLKSMNRYDNSLNQAWKDPHTLYTTFVYDAIHGDYDINTVVPDTKSSIVSFRNKPARCYGYQAGYPSLFVYTLDGGDDGINLVRCYQELYKNAGEDSLRVLSNIEFYNMAFIFGLDTRYISKYGLSIKKVIGLLATMSDDKVKTDWFMHVLHAIIDNGASMDFGSKITEKWINDHFMYPADFLVESSFVFDYDAYNDLLHDTVAKVNAIVANQKTCSLGVDIRDVFACSVFDKNGREIKPYSAKTMEMFDETLRMLGAIPDFMWRYFDSLYREFNAMIRPPRSYNGYTLVQYVREINAILKTGDMRVLCRAIIWCHFVAVVRCHRRAMDASRTFCENGHINELNRARPYIYDGALPRRFPYDMHFSFDVSSSVPYAKIVDNLRTLPAEPDDMRRMLDKMDNPDGLQDGLLIDTLLCQGIDM